MSIRRIKQRMRGEFQPRAICSTGVEEALIAEAIAGEMLAGGGTLLGSAGLEAGLSASSLMGGFGGFSLPFGISPESLGLNLASTAMRGVAASDAASRRQKLVDAMAKYQKGNARKIEGETNQYVDTLTPDARTAQMDQAAAENKAGYESTVGAAQAFERPGGVAGNVSDQYKAKAAESADAQAARTKSLIENLSKMRAPGTYQGDQSRRFGKVASDVDSLTSMNRGMGNAYQTAIAGVQESPWLNMGGDALSGIGQGLAIRDATANALKQLRASAL